MIRSWLTQSFSEQPRQKKRAPRHVDPGVNAFYWDGGAPSARQLKDISMTGAYLYTSDRWYLGTLIELMLQSASEAGEGGSKKDLSVLCRVTRHGADGLGVKFLMPTDLHRKKVELPPEEFPGYKGERIACAECGEGISYKREVVRESHILCRACAGERYYSVTES